MVRALSYHRFNSGTCYHMWVEFVVGSCRCSKSFPSSTRTNILNSSGNSGKEELFRGMSVGAGRVSLQTTCRIMNVELTCRAGWMDGGHPTVDEGVDDYEIFWEVNVWSR